MRTLIEHGNKENPVTHNLPIEWTVELMDMDELLTALTPHIPLHKFLHVAGLQVEALAHASHEVRAGRTLIQKRRKLPPHIEEADYISRVVWREVIEGDRYEEAHLEEFKEWLALQLVTLERIREHRGEQAWKEARMKPLRHLNTAAELAQWSGPLLKSPVEVTFSD